MAHQPDTLDGIRAFCEAEGQPCTALDELLDEPRTLGALRAIVRNELLTNGRDFRDDSPTFDWQATSHGSRALRDLVATYVALGGDLELADAKVDGDLEDLLEAVAPLVRQVGRVLEVLGPLHRDEFTGRLDVLVAPLNELGERYPIANAAVSVEEQGR